MTFLQFVHAHILFSFLLSAGLFCLLFVVMLALVDISANLSRIGRKTIVNHHHHGASCDGNHAEGPCPKS